MNEIIRSEHTTSRQELIPHFDQSSLSSAKVMVAGAGATGNEVIKNLALTGFGYLFVTDMDCISTSNLSRTVLFTKEDVGKPKAERAAEEYMRMNIATPSADFFSGDICTSLGEGVFRRMDLVIGCVDNIQTRIFLSHVCKLHGIPYIDTGINAFNWNLFTTDGSPSTPCFACTMSSKQESKALARVRNSCDVTRKKAFSEGHAPTIAVSAASVSALAVQEAIKIRHHQVNPDSSLQLPLYSQYTFFDSSTNSTKNINVSKRSDCRHHDCYSEFGSIIDSPLSSRSTLSEALKWAEHVLEGDCRLSIQKDNSCADRAFIETAYCKHCGKEMSVFKPQFYLDDTSLLCDTCKSEHLPPRQLSMANSLLSFGWDNSQKTLGLTLSELGIPMGHIVEFYNSSDSVFVELSGDIPAVMPNLCMYHKFD